MCIRLFKRFFYPLCVLLLAGSLSGCIYWIRAYQTYIQMSEFDRYFKTVTTDEFTLHFKAVSYTHLTLPTN